MLEQVVAPNFDLPQVDRLRGKKHVGIGQRRARKKHQVAQTNQLQSVVEGVLKSSQLTQDLRAEGWMEK